MTRIGAEGEAFEDRDPPVRKVFGVEVPGRASGAARAADGAVTAPRDTSLREQVDFRGCRLLPSLIPASARRVTGS